MLLYKRRFVSYFVVLLLISGFTAGAQDVQWLIPVGGNSWVKPAGTNDKAVVTDTGWEKWTNTETQFDTWFKLTKSGKLKVSVLLNTSGGTSDISFAINGNAQKTHVSANTDQWFTAGEWAINNAGYTSITTRGISKTGAAFAVVKAFKISGDAVDSNTAFVKNNEGNYFYWGRRGPSVHINYNLPEHVKDIEWFYNEITVPPGNDVVGSYFMADGFAEGYFGMQVNSATERRIIFSVWSPFNTDNPKEIPDSQKIVVLKKGKDVLANEFGNEGSGGHSHLMYNWKAGQPCKFLLHAQPADNNCTIYTAYFFNVEAGAWQLVASFKRPSTHTYLKRLHSFLENFIPETGNISRMAFYQNQWIKPLGAAWLPITNMRLTADATARKGYRLDYNGGVLNGKFFLHNDGFFNETGDLKINYTSRNDQMPVIDFSVLP